MIMRQVLRLALTAATLALSAQLAHARGVNIPAPGAVTYTCNDADGTGRMTVTRVPQRSHEPDRALPGETNAKQTQIFRRTNGALTAAL